MPLDDLSRRPVEIPIIPMPVLNPIPVEVTPITIIDEMLELLTPGRWCKRIYVHFGGHGGIVQLCMVGALYTVDRGTGLAKYEPPRSWTEFQTDAARQVYQRLKSNLHVQDCVSGWNDADTTYYVHVIDLLKRTRSQFVRSYRLKRLVFFWRR